MRRSMKESVLGGCRSTHYSNPTGVTLNCFPNIEKEIMDTKLCLSSIVLGDSKRYSLINHRVLGILLHLSVAYYDAKINIRRVDHVIGNSYF